MPLPDKHADEPAVQIDKDVYEAWKEAKDAAEQWKRHAEDLKRKLIAMVGEDAYAGLIDDQKVITYRPTNGWATSSLIKDYPDLTKHHMVEQVNLELDVEAFGKQHPEVLEKYRIRQFRLVEE